MAVSIATAILVDAFHDSFHFIEAKFHDFYDQVKLISRLIVWIQIISKPESMALYSKHRLRNEPFAISLQADEVGL